MDKSPSKFNIAMENPHFQWVIHYKWTIFHSNVKLTEGVLISTNHILGYGISCGLSIYDTIYTIYHIYIYLCVHTSAYMKYRYFQPRLLMIVCVPQFDSKYLRFISKEIAISSQRIVSKKNGNFGAEHLSFGWLDCNVRWSPLPFPPKNITPWI